MNAPHPNRDTEKAENILPSPHSAGRNRRDERGTATMIASPHKAAGSSAGRGSAGSLSFADWLTLAAAPTFGIMALLVARSSESSPLGGMVLMYVLMAVFESVAWLKLISNLRSGSTSE